MSSVYERAARCCLSGVSLWFDWINIVLIKTQSKVNKGNFMLTIRRTLETVWWSLDICCSINAGEMKWLELTCELCGLYTRAVCTLYTVHRTLYSCLLKRNVSSVSTLAVDTCDPWYSEQYTNDGYTKTTQFVVISLLDELHFLATILLTSLTLVKRTMPHSYYFPAFITPNSLKKNLFGKIICGLLVSGTQLHILKLN